jgi:hypothetical protein
MCTHTILSLQEERFNPQIPSPKKSPQSLAPNTSASLDLCLQAHETCPEVPVGCFILFCGFCFFVKLQLNVGYLGGEKCQLSYKTTCALILASYYISPSSVASPIKRRQQHLSQKCFWGLNEMMHVN